MLTLTLAIFRHQKHTLTFQFTQPLTYLNIQTHKYTYTDSHTYIDTPSLTPSAHVLGQAGESSMYLLPKSSCSNRPGLPHILASRTGQEADDRLIIPTIRDFLRVFKAP